MSNHHYCESITSNSGQQMGCHAHNGTPEHVLQRTMSRKTSVFQLPKEMISEIFKLTQLNGGEDSYEVYKMRWIVVAHICRYWRGIAIDTQALWTYIDTDLQTCTEQTKTFLKRSGTSSLVVHHCSRFNIPALERLSLALKHIHRIRELHIWVLFEVSEDIQSSLKTPAPLMESFFLDAFRGNSLDPNTLFGGSAPKLSILSLSTSSSSWAVANAPIMQNLRDVSVGSFTSPITLQDTYTIFLRNPNIEKFRIYQQPEIAHPDDLHPPQSQINLPFLKKLTVTEGNYELISALLKNIVSPNLFLWEMDCQNYPLLSTAAVDPKGIIPDTTCDYSICDIVELKISPDCVQIEADCGFRAGPGETDIQVSKSLKYTWDLEDGEDNWDTATIADGFDVITSAVKDEFWSTTKKLFVLIKIKPGTDWHVNFSSRTWRKLLNRFPVIQLLSVYYTDNQRRPIVFVRESHILLLQALSFSRESEEEERHFICPQLMTLHLSGMNLRKDLPELVYRLSRRAAYGYRLSKLELGAPLGLSDVILSSLQRMGFADEITVDTGARVENSNEMELQDSDYTEDNSD